MSVMRTGILHCNGACRGITLKKYIEKRGKIPFKEAVSIAIQVSWT